MSIKITDGFVFSTVTEEEAQSLFETDSIYVMYPLEDDRYWEAETDDDLQDDGDEIILTIKLGTEAELKVDWQEAKERNRDPRNFHAWLKNKAESLIY